MRTDNVRHIRHQSSPSSPGFRSRHCIVSNVVQVVGASQRSSNHQSTTTFQGETFGSAVARDDRRLDSATSGSSRTPHTHHLPLNPYPSAHPPLRPPTPSFILRSPFRVFQRLTSSHNSHYSTLPHTTLVRAESQTKGRLDEESHVVFLNRDRYVSVLIIIWSTWFHHLPSFVILPSRSLGLLVRTTAASPSQRRRLPRPAAASSSPLYLRSSAVHLAVRVQRWL